MAGSRAIIIGGGVIGLSTAYHLASRKYGQVTVLDKGLVGEGSSSRAAGIITGLLWDEPGVAARKKSLELFNQFSRELDGYQFRSVGCLNLFDEPSWPSRASLLPLYERLGAPFAILNTREIRSRWPALAPPEGTIGLFDPMGGYSEPAELIPALARRCIALGVDIRERQQVTGFATRGGRVCGVRTVSGETPSDAVICTVHAWTLAVLQNLGVRFPFKNFVHQRYVSGPLPVAPAIPAVNAGAWGGYLRPASQNRLLAGIETTDREEYRVDSPAFEMSTLTAPSRETRDLLLQNLLSLTTSAPNAPWSDEKIGLISFSADGNPILGPLSAWPGLFVALAFHSGGFAYSPVAGLLLAEFVEKGHTAIDVSAFSPERFDAEETESYLSTRANQTQAVRRRH